MDENGRGYRKAAKHFGLKVNTVKAWKRRAKTSASVGGCTPAEQDGVHPTDMSLPGSSPGAPTAAGSKGVHPKGPPAPRFVPSGSRAVLSADAMDVEARTKLRRSVNRLLSYLSGDLDEPLVTVEELVQGVDLGAGRRVDVLKALKLLQWSPRGAKEASVALGILIDKCPDILAFEDKLNGDGVGEASGPCGEAASSRVRAALGVVDTDGA